MRRALMGLSFSFCILGLSCKTGPAKNAPITPAAASPSVVRGAEGDVFPGKPVVRLCKLAWSQERCCAFLCSGLKDICSDSPRAKPGIDSCPTWCPTLSDKAVRCHVYHCYDSISPTGGIKDHDSHCRHAANELRGGACPAVVYEAPGDASAPPP